MFSQTPVCSNYISIYQGLCEIFQSNQGLQIYPLNQDLYWNLQSENNNVKTTSQISILIGIQKKIGILSVNVNPARSGTWPNKSTSCVGLLGRFWKILQMTIWNLEFTKSSRKQEVAEACKQSKSISTGSRESLNNQSLLFKRSDCMTCSIKLLGRSSFLMQNIIPGLLEIDLSCFSYFRLVWQSLNTRIQYVKALIQYSISDIFANWQT